MLFTLRSGLAEVLGYEDVGILVKDATTPAVSDSNVFCSLSPNISADRLNKSGNYDLFYYNPPSNSLASHLMEGKAANPTVYANPRDCFPYYEGIDNLSPVG